MLNAAMLPNVMVLVGAARLLALVSALAWGVILLGLYF